MGNVSLLRAHTPPDHFLSVPKAISRKCGRVPCLCPQGDAALHLGPLPAGDPGDVAHTEPQLQPAAQPGLVTVRRPRGKGPRLGRWLSGAPWQPGETCLPSRSPSPPAGPVLCGQTGDPVVAPTLARRPCCSSAGRWSPHTAATRTSRTTCPPLLLPSRGGGGGAAWARLAASWGTRRREEEEGSGIRSCCRGRAPGAVTAQPPSPRATSGVGSEACAPCSPQPRTTPSGRLPERPPAPFQ